MDLEAEQTTMAGTVYSRRELVLGAIQSALAEIVHVRVISVEDCGTDPRMKGLIVGEFGSRITYFRNPRRRGLFDNWNACMEYCATPWISILHDDDLLHPWWAETMLTLTGEAPGRMLYFGRSGLLDERGQTNPVPPVAWQERWRDLDLVEFADLCFVLFPGQLFRIADARAVGGVRPFSYFTGDWDLWFRLGLRGGVAQAEREVSGVCSHNSEARGASAAERQ